MKRKGKVFIYGVLVSILLSGCSGKNTDSANSPQIFINEIAAENNGIEKDFGWNTAEDEWKYEFNDWIEIYNPNDEPVDLGGMYLSDNPDKPKKWKIPKDNSIATLIEAKGYLIFWCDEEESEGTNHTNFKLSKMGETLTLYDKDGKTKIDELSFPKQKENINYGRAPDGTDRIGFLSRQSARNANPPSPLSANTYQVDVSPTGGLRNEETIVSLSNKEGKAIYYTLNGNNPTKAKGILYTQPINIEQTQVLRASVIEEGMLAGDIATNTYIINDPTGLPVVSLVLDEKAKDDPWFGVLHENNEWEIDWHQQGNVEYYDNDENHTLIFNTLMGVKVQGAFSRNSPKKSFTIYTDELYGDAKIHHKFFADRDYDTFDGFVIRADMNYAIRKTDEDRWKAGDRVKNELVYRIDKQFNSWVPTQAYVPTILFINGKYWGIYNFQERKNDGFMRNVGGYDDKDDFDIINPHHDQLYKGDWDHYHAMIQFMEHNDLSLDAHYDKLKDMIDIESFIDAWLWEVWIAKGDCNRNSRLYRSRANDGLWKTISYDQDHWKWDTAETLEKIASYYKMGKSNLFHRMMVNRQFRHLFVNRMSDALNTVLLPDTIHRYVDEIMDYLKDEKQRDYDRWIGNIPWEEPLGKQAGWVKWFAIHRPDYIRKHMREELLVGQPVDVTLRSDPSKGKIKVNWITPDHYPWVGQYHKNVPITITAVPNEGYKFKKWKQKHLPKNQTIKVDLISSFQAEAVWVEK